MATKYYEIAWQHLNDLTLYPVVTVQGNPGRMNVLALRGHGGVSQNMSDDGLDLPVSELLFHAHWTSLYVVPIQYVFMTHPVHVCDCLS